MALLQSYLFMAEKSMYSTKRTCWTRHMVNRVTSCESHKGIQIHMSVSYKQEQWKPVTAKEGVWWRKRLCATYQLSWFSRILNMSIGLRIIEVVIYGLWLLSTHVALGSFLYYLSKMYRFGDRLIIETVETHELCDIPEQEGGRDVLFNKELLTGVTLFTLRYHHSSWF